MCSIQVHKNRARNVLNGGKVIDCILNPFPPRSKSFLTPQALVGLLRKVDTGKEAKIHQKLCLIVQSCFRKTQRGFAPQSKVKPRL